MPIRRTTSSQLLGGLIMLAGDRDSELGNRCHGPHKCDTPDFARNHSHWQYLSATANSARIFDLRSIHSTEMLRPRLQARPPWSPPGKLSKFVFNASRRSPGAHVSSATSDPTHRHFYCHLKRTQVMTWILALLCLATFFRPVVALGGGGGGVSATTYKSKPSCGPVHSEAFTLSRKSHRQAEVQMT